MTGEDEPTTKLPPKPGQKNKQAQPPAKQVKKPANDSSESETDSDDDKPGMTFLMCSTSRQLKSTPDLTIAFANIRKWNPSTKKLS